MINEIKLTKRGRYYFQNDLEILVNSSVVKIYSGIKTIIEYNKEYLSLNTIKLQLEIILKELCINIKVVI